MRVPVLCSQSAATVEACPIFADGAGAADGARDANEVPHILQKFMPGGFTVPQLEHVASCEVEAWKVDLE